MNSLAFGMETTDPREKRSSANLWVNPKSQLTQCFMLSAGFVAIDAILIFIMLNFESYLETLKATHQIDSQTIILIASYLFFYLRILTFISSIFAVFGFFVGIMLSHRVYGPIVPIRAHVKRLIEGDYTSRVHTRKYDEFKELTADLNTLADRLNQRHISK